MNIAKDICQVVGNTPLVRLNRLSEGCVAEVDVKMECMNPLSSVKDRIAVSMIEAAEKDGSLSKGATVIEPTSGNTGIGLAMVCAAKGYKLKLVMPDTMSPERRRIMAVLGAELILTPGSEGMKGAINKASQLVESTPGSFIPQQFNNPANPEVHSRTTAEEIWRDTDGKIDIFVAGVGTGGTITGVASNLKKKNPDMKAIAVEPSDSPVLSGGDPGPHKIQGIGAGFIPNNCDTSLLDEIIKVDQDAAGNMARELARKEGIFVGISAGGNAWAAIEVAKRPENQGKRVVTVMCDTGERYLSTWLFEKIGE
ncbi:MAG: cysteine synthase A [Candidatus Sumerlaeia bacterium]